MPGGACEDGLTQADCLLARGTYHGAGANCLGDSNGNGIDDLCEEAPIPTVSEWGLLILALMLLTSIKIKFGGRRSSAA
jgi:hypothetical protein